MKVLLLLLPLALLTGCNRYGPRTEAREACWDWVREYGVTGQKRRDCDEDRATRQYLGRFPVLGEVQKRFYY